MYEFKPRVIEQYVSQNPWAPLFDPFSRGSCQLKVGIVTHGTCPPRPDHPVCREPLVRGCP